MFERRKEAQDNETGTRHTWSLRGPAGAVSFFIDTISASGNRFAGIALHGRRRKFDFIDARPDCPFLDGCACYPDTADGLGLMSNVDRVPIDKRDDVIYAELADWYNTL